MKILFLIILVLCIGSMECQKKGKGKPPKNLCQKDIQFLVSVMRVCNAFRRATRFRMKSWPSLRKYIRYALVLTLKNKPPPKDKGKDKDKGKPKGQGEKDKNKNDKNNTKTRSFQDDFSFDDAGTGNFFDDDENSFIPDDDNDDDQSQNAVDDEEETEDSESDDAPSEQSDAEEEIKKLRRYLEHSGRYRDKRAPKGKGKRPPPSKDPFRSLRILCYKMSRLMYRG